MPENVISSPSTREVERIRPQSLLFTLYGDYIHHYGDRIAIRSLIRLLAHFGISDQAVRTTISRMTRRGWLSAERNGNHSSYVFTDRARQVVQEGTARIFDAPQAAEPWNHCWHLVTYFIPEEHRSARDQFRRELGWLGYGMLTQTVWVSPRHQTSAVQALAARLDIQNFVQTFHASSEGFLAPAELVTRCWDLGGLNLDYANFIACHAATLNHYRAQQDAQAEWDAGECFARRVLLIHQYRKFPYRDPYLPNELLPREWCGWEAAALFRDYHTLLAARANEYFLTVYEA
ncbi:phenylacetic acid degradation operon negative regulatory protein PaaX [Anaerolineae bacterium CFX7]|nr:phenylacetic acid degradation operon negative regulatory protein PaaX [Anaerolineae bacterium CFX7]